MAQPGPPSEPSMSELHTLQAQLAEMVAGVRKFQDQLRQATLDADERTRTLQAKVQELEAQILSQAFDIRELEAENARLLHTLEARNPDLAKITRERDEALQERRNAHRVIEDLLNRQKGVRTETVNAVTVPANDQTSVGRGLLIQHPKREPDVESDDDSTVRPLPSVASRSVTPANVPTLNRTDLARTKKPVLRVSSQDTDASVSSAPFSPKEPSSSGKKRISWYLEFAKPPATAEIQTGPIPFEVLAERLILDEDTTDQIGSLEFMSGYDTRIQCPEPYLAFMYRPIILEGPSHTYLIGWGDASTIRNVQGWTQGVRELNIFCYPAMENSGWYYLGIHILSYAPLDAIWGKLSKEDKARLLVELEDRNPGMNSSQFRREVREGTLMQCCIQLESNNKKAESLEFMRTYGLFEGDG